MYSDDNTVFRDSISRMSNLNFDGFQVKPQFWFGDRVSVIDEDDQISEGVIKGLNYVLDNYLPREPNITDCYYHWKYRVQFEEGYLWVEEDDLLENNQPTI